MKKIVFVLGIFLLLFSCKKKDFTSFIQGCPGIYNERSSPIDMAIYDSVSIYYTPENSLGCAGLEPTVSDTGYSFVIVNPNNPYKILFRERKNNYNYKLLSYNFCNNTVSNIGSNMTMLSAIDWSETGYIFINKYGLMLKVSSDGAIIDTLFSGPTGRYVKCSPNGADFCLVRDSSETSTFSAQKLNIIYTKEGDLVKILPESTYGSFLGWYDNQHILTSRAGITYKIDINSGQSLFFVSGEYKSYSNRVNRFVKRVDSLGYYKLEIFDVSGNKVCSTKYHFYKSAKIGLHTPVQFLNEDKIIMGLITQEYYPNVHTPSCALIERYRIAVMNEDGTNVRVVNFPE